MNSRNLVPEAKEDIEKFAAKDELPITYKKQSQLLIKPAPIKEIGVLIMFSVHHNSYDYSNDFSIFCSYSVNSSKVSR